MLCFVHDHLNVALESCILDDWSYVWVGLEWSNGFRYTENLHVYIYGNMVSQASRSNEDATHPSRIRQWAETTLQLERLNNYLRLGAYFRIIYKTNLYTLKQYTVRWDIRMNRWHSHKGARFKKKSRIRISSMENLGMRTHRRSNVHLLDVGRGNQKSDKSFSAKKSDRRG